MNRPQKTLIISLLSLSFLALPAVIMAQVLPPCTSTGNCGFCDFIQTFVNIIRWVLGILGGSALVLMIFHGLTWLTAAGNKEKIDAGRKGLMHTVIGIVIILGSWFIINSVLTILLTDPGKTDLVQTLFSSSSKKWYEFCKGANTDGDTFCEQGYGEGTPCDNAGGFCLKRCDAWNADNSVCVNEKLSCSRFGYNTKLPDFVYPNACAYWSCHPSRNEFWNYACVSNVSSCVPGKILGPDYCTGNEICCENTTKEQGYHYNDVCPKIETNQSSND